MQPPIWKKFVNVSGFAERNRSAIADENRRLREEESVGIRAKSGIGTVRFDLGGGVWDERDAEELEDDPVYGGIATEALFKREIKSWRDQADALDIELSDPSKPRKLTESQRAEILAEGAGLGEDNPRHAELKKALMTDEEIQAKEKAKWEAKKRLQELGQMGVNGFRQQRVQSRLSEAAKASQAVSEQESVIAAREAEGVKGRDLQAHAQEKAQVMQHKQAVEIQKQSVAGAILEEPNEDAKKLAEWQSMKPDQRLAKKLQDSKLFSSITQSIGITSDKSLVRRSDGSWDTPAVVKQYDNQIFNAVKSGLTAVRAKVGMRGGGTVDETQAMNEALYQFQQENNLSDEEVVRAWNDFTARNNESWQDDEKLRVLSDGEIILNASAPEILDREKLSKVIESANAPDEQKARALENLDYTRKNVAEQRLMAYEAAGVGIESPSEYAARTGRGAGMLNDPDFILEYEQKVLGAEGEVAKKARGFAGDVVLGFNKLATTVLGAGAQLTNSETMGQLAAAGSEGGQVVGQGKPDTGIVGAVVQEAPSLAAMVVGAELIGAAGAGAGIGATAMSWISRAGSLTMAGGQSLGATYADERAQGKTHEEAEEVALRSGINTAIITGVFNALPGMAGFEKYTGGAQKKVADVTMREIFKSTSKQELAARVSKFARDKVLAGVSEGLEEGVDELTNAFINAEPDTNLSTAWQNAIEAAKVGALIGTAVDVVGSTGFGNREKINAAVVAAGGAEVTPEEERKLAEIAGEEVDPAVGAKHVLAMREIDKISADAPELALRSSGSLKIARGMPLEELTSEEITALGVDRTGKPLGGETPAMVEMVNGRAILLDGAIRELETAAPSSKGLISMTEGEARQKFAKTKFTVTSKGGKTVEVEARNDQEAGEIAAKQFDLGDQVDTVTPLAATGGTAKGNTPTPIANTPAGAKPSQPVASQPPVTPVATTPATPAVAVIEKIRAKSKGMAKLITVSTDPATRVMATDAGITVNPDALMAEAVANGLDEKQAAEWVGNVIDEEVRHMVQFRAAESLYKKSKSKLSLQAWRSQHYGAVWNTEFVATGKAEIVRKLYGEQAFDKMPEWKKAMEGIRMMWQQNETQSQTETAKLWTRVSDAVIAELKAVLEVLKSLAKDDALSPSMKRELALLQKKLKELEIAPEKPAAKPADASQGQFTVGQRIEGTVHKDDAQFGGQKISGVIAQVTPSGTVLLVQADGISRPVRVLTADAKAVNSDKTPDKKPESKPEAPAAVSALPAPTAQDWQDRAKFVGEHFAGPPNSVVIQPRDMDSNPIGEHIVLPLQDSMEATAEMVASGFTQAIGNGSWRESLVKVIGADGKAVAQMKYDADSGKMLVAKQSDLEAARLNTNYTYRQSVRAGLTQHIVRAANERTGKMEDRVFDTLAEAQAEMDRIDELMSPATEADMADFFSWAKNGLAAAPLAPFYSKLERVIDQKMPNVANAGQVMQIAMQNAKAEEVKWSGLQQALVGMQDEKGKVTKAAVLGHLRNEGAVRFEEVVMSSVSSPKIVEEEADDGTLGFSLYNGDEFVEWYETRKEAEDNAPNLERVSGGTKYAQYVLPGGENYREVVLAMPPKQTVVDDPEELGLKEIDPAFHSRAYEYLEQYKKGEVTRSMLPKLINALPRAIFTSNHFPDVPNYVAHMRTNERDGGLFIEELQSDRHQEGRKKGYKEDLPPVIDIAPIQEELRVLRIQRNEQGETPALNQLIEDTEQRLIDAQSPNVKQFNAVADAPFRTTWPLALFKRALRDAVAGGKDWIGWTTGETQGDRFDLSKQVDAINVDKTSSGQFIVKMKPKGAREWQDVDMMNEAKLVDTIGKDLAQKVVESPESRVTFEGDGLKTESAGMKGFYDNMLPKEIGKYVKQWGAKVEKDAVGTVFEVVVNGSVQKTTEVRAIADNVAKNMKGAVRIKNATPIWRVDITDDMRAGVEAGQELFAAPLAPSSVTSEQDAAYLAAVQAGDMETAQRMVDEAAKKAGYDVKAYHGTNSRFNIFEVGRKGVRRFMFMEEETTSSGMFFSPREDDARGYGRKVLSVFLNLRNQLVEPPLSSRSSAEERARYEKYLEDLEFILAPAIYGEGETRYIDTDNGMSRTEIDPDGEWVSKVFSGVEIDWGLLDNPEVVSRMKARGYDSVAVTENNDMAGFSWFVTNPEQIKSADPVTRDEQGNVIPLSKRFNPASDSILYAANLNGMNPDRVKEAMAQQEEFGNAVKPPNRASMGDETTRKAVDVFDIEYEERRERETRKQWVEGGTERAKNNRKALIENAKANAYGKVGDGIFPLTPEDIVGTQIVIEQMVKEAGNDFDKLIEAGTVIQAYRTMRSNVARVLASGWDRFMKPEERNRRFLANAILTLPPKVAAQIARKQLTPEQSKIEIRRELQQRLTKIEKALKEYGVTINEVLGKQVYVSLDKKNVVKDIMKDATKDEALAIRMHQQHADAAKIAKTCHMTVAEVEKLVKKVYDEALQRMIEKARAGMTLETSGLQAATLLTEEQIIAEARRMVEVGLGLSPTVHTPSTRALARKAKIKVESEPEKINWSRPEFTSGLLSYTFDSKDLAEIKRTSQALIDATAATAKVETLTGKKRQEAEAMLAKLESILAKYGTSVQQVVESGKPLESYRFDITDRVHVHLIANAIRSVDADAIDKGVEWYYFSMLSGLQTMMVNASSVVHGIFDATIGRGAEMILNAFLRNPMNASLGETKYILKAMGPMMSRARSNFAASFGAETPFFEQDILGVPPDLESVLEGHGMYHRTAISGKKGQFIRIPTRILLATDEFVKTINAMTEVGAMAYRICRAGNLKPGTKEFDDKMKELVNIPGSLAWQMAASKAYNRTFTNALPGQKDLATGKTRETRTIGEVAGAVVGAAQKGLNFKTDTMVAKLGLTLLRLMFFPFVKVPYNITALAMTYTPLSLIDIATLYAQSRGIKGKAERQKAQAEVIERMSRVMIGGIVAGFMLGAGEGDDDDLDKPLLITGSRPYKDTKKGVRELGQRMGVDAYSISWPLPNGRRGVFHYGRIEPIATVLATTIDTMRELKQAGRGRQGYDDAVTQSVRSFSDQLSDKTFLKGLGDAYKTWRGEQNLSKFAADKIAMAVPNLIKQPIRETDPYFRDKADTFGEELLSAIYPSGIREPKVDIYGEKSTKLGNSLTRIFDFSDAGTVAVRKVDEMLWRYQQKNPDAKGIPTMASDKYTPVTGEGQKEMTENQARMYRERAGRNLTNILKTKTFNYESPTERDIENLNKAIDMARDAAKKSLKYDPNWK